MFDFPTSPPLNTTVTLPDGSTRVWDGTKWTINTGSSPPATGISTIISASDYGIVSDYNEYTGTVSWLGSTVTITGANFNIVTSSPNNPYLLMPAGGPGGGPAIAQIVTASGTTATVSMPATVSTATGSITTTVLTVTAGAAGSVMPNGVLSGTGVTVGTQVVAQLTATPVAATGSIASGVMTVTAAAAGSLAAGGQVTGTGVLAGTRIMSQLPGGTAGGVGTYAVFPAQTVASTALTVIGVLGGPGTYTVTPAQSVASTTISVSYAFSGLTNVIGQNSPWTIVQNTPGNGVFKVNDLLTVAGAAIRPATMQVIQTTVVGATIPANAVVTGSITNDGTTTTLHVTGVTSGLLYPGGAISGSGIAAGTLIIAQVAGADTGGVGDYTVNILQAVASTTVTATYSGIGGAPPDVATMTASITLTTMTVTAVATGTILVGATVTGGTVAANTTIISQLTSTAAGGALGSTGTYQVSISQSVVSAALMATVPSVVYMRGTTGHGRRIVLMGTLDNTGKLSGNPTLVDGGAYWIDPAGLLAGAYATPTEIVDSNTRSIILHGTWAAGGNVITITSDVHDSMLPFIHLGQTVTQFNTDDGSSGFPGNSVVTNISGRTITVSRPSFGPGLTGGGHKITFTDNNRKAYFQATFANNSTTITATAPLPASVAVGQVIFGSGINGGADPTNLANACIITAIAGTTITISRPTTVDASYSAVGLSTIPYLQGTVVNLTFGPARLQYKDFGAYVGNPKTAAAVTASITATTMTVTAVTSGVPRPGGLITGGTVAAGTTIISQLTGPPGGIGTYQVSIPQSVVSTALTVTHQLAASLTALATGSITATVLTVTAISSGEVRPGALVAGTNVTVGTTIVSQLTGLTGSTGTYQVSISQSVASTSLTLSSTIIVTPNVGTAQISCGTDNSAALNAWTSAIRSYIAALGVSVSPAAAFEAIIPPGMYLTLSSINAGAIHAHGAMMELSGVLIHSAAAGLNAWSAVGARWYKMHGPMLIQGDQLFPPDIGFIIGRTDIGNACSDMALYDISCTGFFVFAAHLIANMEGSTIMSFDGSNARPCSGPAVPTDKFWSNFGKVYDGNNHYRKLAWPPFDTHQSFLGTTETNGTSSGGGCTAPWSIVGNGMMKQTRGYAANWAGPAIFYANAGHSDLDIHCEVETLTDGIFIWSIDNGAASFGDGSFEDSAFYATNALFAYDTEGNFGVKIGAFSVLNAEININPTTGGACQIFDRTQALPGGANFYGDIYIGTVLYTAMSHYNEVVDDHDGQLLRGDTRTNIAGDVVATATLTASENVAAGGNVTAGGEVDAANGFYVTAGGGQPSHAFLGLGTLRLGDVGDPSLTTTRVPWLKFFGPGTRVANWDSLGDPSSHRIIESNAGTLTIDSWEGVGWTGPVGGGFANVQVAGNISAYSTSSLYRSVSTLDGGGTLATGGTVTAQLSIAAGGLANASDTITPDGDLVIRNSASLAALTIRMPNETNCLDGQEVLLCTDNAIGTVTFASQNSGTYTIVGAPAAMVANTPVRFKLYKTAGGNKWKKL